jgi:hypothetical protein
MASLQIGTRTQGSGFAFRLGKNMQSLSGGRRRSRRVSQEPGRSGDVVDAQGKRRRNMRLRFILATSVAFTLLTPAFAADSFYVVQDAKTKKCTVTESKPTTSETTVVSGNTVYKTRSEAESGMKTTKVCTTN